MNACHLYTVTSLISTLYTALATVRGLTSDIVYGILGAAVLLIVVVSGVSFVPSLSRCTD